MHSLAISMIKNLSAVVEVKKVGNLYKDTPTLNKAQKSELKQCQKVQTKLGLT